MSCRTCHVNHCYIRDKHIGTVRVFCLHCFHCLPVNVLMLNTTELSKRKRSQVSADNDTEPSPSSVQLLKKMASQNSVMHSVSHSTGP